MASDQFPVGSTERVPLRFARGFSTRAVAVVIAEKFGWRGLRIAAMIGGMIGWLAWKGSTALLSTLLYGFAVIALVLFAGVVWTAKEALDKFVAQYQGNAWLIVDDGGVGGEVDDGPTSARFKLPWSSFRRVVERNGLWLLETREGAWMVLPTTAFTPGAWQIFRRNAHGVIPRASASTAGTGSDTIRSAPRDDTHH